MRRPSIRRRVAAAGAIVMGAVTVADGFVSVTENLLAGAATLAGLALALVLVWQGVLRHARARAAWFIAAGVLVALILVALGAAGLIRDLLVFCLGTISTAAAVRVAFGPRGSMGGAWRPAKRTQRPVLLVNPQSGGGKAGRAAVTEHAQTCGIEAVVLGPDDDLEQLAREAVRRGADALGVAGGDGSLAAVAAIAATHELPFVCVPAGTRNHFALDLGVDRSDLIGAIDAFNEGLEQRIDLAEVNSRPFLNNVSLGVYAEAIRKPGYRDAKVRTLLDTVRAVLGPSGALPKLFFRDDRGHEHAGPALVLVSNGPYAIDRVIGRGTRPRLDSGRLGIVAIDPPGDPNSAWAAPTFVIEGNERTPAGVDGEAVILEPPLRCTSRPGALCVRISPRHPGLSPSARLPRRLRVVVPRLARIAAGRA